MAYEISKEAFSEAIPGEGRARRPPPTPPARRGESRGRLYLGMGLRLGAMASTRPGVIALYSGFSCKMRVCQIRARTDQSRRLTLHQG